MTERLGWLDRQKINAVIAVRRSNRRSIEERAAKTFREARPPDPARPKPTTACAFYGVDDLPLRLMVPDQMPDGAALGLWYLLPYYYLTGATFKVLHAFPIDTAPEWTPDLWFNDAFPPNPEGWVDAMGDDAFARMRVQGANPFLLRRDPSDEARFVVDYGPLFEGIAPEAVRCAFRLSEAGLAPEAIHVGDAAFTPTRPGWTRAKRLANGLDARYDVFTRHLLYSHLLVGQAYALSAYALPIDHPARPFLDLFTYGTLVVNHWAYKLLLSPASYFMRSHFISAPDAYRLFDNSMDAFSLDDLIVPHDIRARGIDTIPGHPFVEDAPEAWAVFDGFVRAWARRHWPDDDAVRGDDGLRAWYARLSELLPGHDITDRPLDGLDPLVTALCCLLQLQVDHEICGDFSVYAAAHDVEHKKLVDFDRLLGRVPDAPPSAADVFLFQQGAFAGRFNNGGNNMMRLDLDACVADPWLRSCARDLQAALAALDGRLEARNAKRQTPFLRLMPRFWEMSISF